MNTTAERVKAFAEANSLSIRSIEMESGITNGLIGKAIKRGAELKSSMIVAILDRFKSINPNWLLRGEGNMYIEGSENTSSNQVAENADPIKHRLIEFVKSEGISKESFYRSIDISPSNFSGKAMISELGSSKVSKILGIYTKINPDWLLNGIGSMYRDSDDERSQGAILSLSNFKTPDIKVESQVIPFYNLTARAGVLSQILECRQNPDDYIHLPNMPRCDGAIFISGDSMYPLLKAGDLIGFSIINDPSYIMWGQMYIVDFSINGDDYLSVKWVQKSNKGDNYVSLVSQNEHHATIEIPRSAIRKMAIVKLSIRQYTNA